MLLLVQNTFNETLYLCLFLASDFCCGIEIEIENCKMYLVSKILVSYKLMYYNRDQKQ